MVPALPAAPWLLLLLAVTTPSASAANDPAAAPAAVTHSGCARFTVLSERLVEPMAVQ
jgi:hypothetical protein